MAGDISGQGHTDVYAKVSALQAAVSGSAFRVMWMSWGKRKSIYHLLSPVTITVNENETKLRVRGASGEKQPGTCQQRGPDPGLRQVEL